jgi:hypothetical protein
LREGNPGENKQDGGPLERRVHGFDFLKQTLFGILGDSKALLCKERVTFW